MDVAYRLCPEVNWQQMAGDPKRAVAWMKAHAAEYSVDTTKIVLAGASAGGQLALLAAKVYRPHMFRSLRNDAMYREGREVLAGDGKPVKKTKDRVMRALGKKTSFGLQVAHTSWLMHEFVTMRRLYEAGGALPRPIAATDNAILMAYLGDAHRAAPTLNEVALEPREAEALFEVVLHNVHLLLREGLVHGDLSAYNILYWEGEIALIDFPQVTVIAGNRGARGILERDVRRVCEYFAGQGVDRDPEALVDGLMENLENALSPFTGTGGVVDGKITATNGQIRGINNKIARIEARLEDRQATLERQYAYLQMQLAQMSYTQSQLGTFWGWDT